LIDYVIIGKRIQELRKQRKWTQSKLAELSEVEPSNISHIERAATKLSLPTLIKIANALEVSLDELVYSNLKKCDHISISRISDLLEDCTPNELNAICEVIATTKSVLRAKK
jgi:transcriptional regulator with XRE-family HTH domain